MDYYKDYYSFVCTQWGSMNAAYSQEPFNEFEAFVHSLKFLKKDFYENLEDELNRGDYKGRRFFTGVLWPRKNRKR